MKRIFLTRFYWGFSFSHFADDGEFFAVRSPAISPSQREGGASRGARGAAHLAWRALVKSFADACGERACPRLFIGSCLGVHDIGKRAADISAKGDFRITANGVIGEHDLP